MSRSKTKLAFSIAAIFIFSLIWNFVSLTAAAFFLLFFLWLVFRLDQSILVGAAVLLLASIPVFLWLNREPFAQQIAVYVYYLLAIIVVLQIILFRSREKDIVAISAVEMVQPPETLPRALRRTGKTLVIDIRPPTHAAS